MAGFTSTYLANGILNEVFGGTSLHAALPSAIYAALFLVAPTAGGTGGTEVSASGYARISVTRNTTNFPASTTASISNATVIDFGTPSGSGWGTIVGAGWYDASTGGNLLYYGPFSPSRVATGGSDFQVPIGGFIGTQS